jgi:hypothetical protein
MTRRNRKSSVVTPIALWVPASFDAHSMLPANMLRHADRACYLLDLIVRKRMRWPLDPDGFVRLNAQLLRKQLGHRQSLRLIEVLEGLKVIERRKKPNGDPIYLVGRQCIQYRLLPPYSTDDVRRVWLRDPDVVQMLAERRKRIHCPKSEVHRFLDSWVARTDMQIDAGRRIVRQTPRLARHAILWNAAIDMIASRACPTSVCRMGRYHSILTRTPREFRSCITVDRVTEQLAGVDVANCQPLMIALIVGVYEAAPDRLRARMRLGTLYERARKNPYKLIAGNKRKEDPASPVLILRAANGELRQHDAATGVAPAPASLKNDAIRYLEFCERGTIYETLRHDLSIKDRKAVKQSFVKMAGKPDWSRPFDRGFAKLFPNVVRVMKRIQRKNYRQLARLTQNVEATLVIDRAVRKLMELGNDNLPVISVHDALFTRPEFVTLVGDMLRASFSEVGLSVHLKPVNIPPAVVTTATKAVA